MAETPEATLESETDTYVHAVWRSPRGFRDDVEFRLCAADGIIHVRSASRICLLWDMDVNRLRVEDLRRRLIEEEAR